MDVAAVKASADAPLYNTAPFVAVNAALVPPEDKFVTPPLLILLKNDSNYLSRGSRSKLFEMLIFLFCLFMLDYNL